MTTKTIELPLCVVKIDGGTQQRDLCEATLQGYTERMQAGDTFPPIEAVHDGKAYWLWDGFHRYFAGKKAGLDSLPANVQKGTKRDAVRLSLKANDTHGKPRTAKDIVHAISVIEADEEWQALQVAEKAEMVGLTVRQYGYYSSEYGKPRKKVEHDGALPHAGVHKEKDSINTEPKKDAEPQDSGGTTPDKHVSKALVADAVGHNVPDGLRDIFLRQQEIKDFINRLDAIKQDVNAALKADPVLWSYFRTNPFNVELANVRRQFRFAVPYAVCPYCGGIDSDKCKGCKGTGFLNEDIYKNTVPKELKG